jgi:pimeloyl-ACP methyl ester carboxylesterase
MRACAVATHGPKPVKFSTIQRDHSPVTMHHWGASGFQVLAFFCGYNHLLNERVMKRYIIVVAILFIVTTTPGCSNFWGRDALNVESLSSVTKTKRSLVVLLPGIGGEGIDYEKEGFVDDMRQHGFGADVLIMNIKPRMYVAGEIVERLRTEIFLPAKTKDYEAIYLVGISLGGHAAILYATRYPEDIEDVLLLSPFISGPIQADQIIDAGGIIKWEKCPFIGWDHACNVWKALKQYVSNPERRDNIYLGYGTNDIFYQECDILAKVLPPEHVFTVEGQHNWTTWEKLWLIALDYFKNIKDNRVNHNSAQ